ncbi:hypothetical protein PYCCODRAFT_1103895 [Trametes coccinea BRFM310]|uniref:Uncharacterized protein n=1 Tax=Trametes coccinea (strain BRFM310) TaxID=1353009 RepID=A0A1Y2I9G6_TRAC3|nr:hypothetical protein PYCCODRAFT_1103895 [Trametes coccinea BRFM310]
MGLDDLAYRLRSAEFQCFLHPAATYRGRALISLRRRHGSESPASLAEKSSATLSGMNRQADDCADIPSPSPHLAMLVQYALRAQDSEPPRPPALTKLRPSVMAHGGGRSVKHRHDMQPFQASSHVRIHHRIPSSPPPRNFCGAPSNHVPVPSYRTRHSVRRGRGRGRPHQSGEFTLHWQATGLGLLPDEA